MRTFVITSQVGERTLKPARGGSEHVDAQFIAAHTAMAIVKALRTVRGPERIVITLTIGESDQSTAAS